MRNAAPHKRRVSIYTLGCRLNQAESRLLAEQFLAAGYTLVPFGETADIGVIHSCTVTGKADAKTRSTTRQFVRANPEAFTAVIGCSAERMTESIAGIKGVDLVLGNQRKMDLLDFIGEAKNAEPRIVRETIRRGNFTIDFAEPACRAWPPGPADCFAHRPNLKIQDGCDYFCSFCTIPFARGRVRAREMDNLLAEAESLARRGAKELILTGINIGLYDYEGADITAVCDRLNAIAGIQRIRISSIELTTVPEALFARMADPAHALLPYLHVPLQSGSNRILEAMKRNYRRKDYIRLVEQAAAVPGIGIGCDIMVGFPGETEQDFQDSYDIFENTPVFYAHIFRYSERRNTPAAKMPGKISPETATERSNRLRRLKEKKIPAFYRGNLGKTLDVLFEEKQSGRWTGYTGSYIRVTIESSENLENQVRPVRLEALEKNIVRGALV
jgi:threonylcarbamoyladenosine tRNA methylthiotransferase MtaB